MRSDASILYDYVNMQERVRLFFIVTSILVGLIFLLLVISLLNRGDIDFTEDAPLTQPALENTDPLLGSSNPDVLIVYFGDFACQQCADISMHLRSVLKEFPNSVLIAWKDFPNASLNSESYRASIAARCAERQNAFWDFHDIIMRNQQMLGDPLYLAAADELDLNRSSFERCLKREATDNLVDASLEQATSLGLPAAPTLFINGERTSGSMREYEIREMVRSYIEE